MQIAICIFSPCGRLLEFRSSHIYQVVIDCFIYFSLHCYLRTNFFSKFTVFLSTQNVCVFYSSSTIYAGQYSFSLSCARVCFIFSKIFISHPQAFPGILLLTSTTRFSLQSPLGIFLLRARIFFLLLDQTSSTQLSQDQLAGQVMMIFSSLSIVDRGGAFRSSKSSMLGKSQLW